MDYTQHWNRLLSDNPSIEGGAFMSMGGALISQMSFGNAIADCAALVTLASELIQDTECGELEEMVLEGEQGYVVLMPVVDKAIFTVLARKKAMLGLVILDMHRAIDDSFGPGLASEPVFPPQLPRHSTAHARPEFD